MSAVGERLGLRLFLEGLEVPVVSAQVQVNINAPATAAIQVVPGDGVLELKARTMVHLFFWDYTLDAVAVPEAPDPERVAEDYGITVDDAKLVIAGSPELFATPEQAELRGYKLLFSGEVVGVVMMKSPTGRQAVLQCSDFSTYWDTTYQFFVSYSPNGNFLGTSAAVWAGGASMFDDLTAGHTSVMNEYLRSKPKTPGLQNVQGLMGGIISLLEGMGGVPRHSHGVNDFFTIAELKNHILQQIVAEQNDDTAQRLFDNKAFNDWLSRGMSSLGQLTTFRDMMKLLFKYVYYEVVPNPAAMYVPALGANVSEKTIKYTKKVELSEGMKRFFQELRGSADRGATKTYHDPVHDDDVQARYFKQALVRNAGEMPAGVKGRAEKCYRWLDKIVSTEKDARVILKPGAQKNLRGNWSSGDFLKVTDSEGHKNNVKYWTKVRDIIDEILGANLRVSGTKKRVARKAAELDRLHTQIFRPDCFFAAPPRCNVLFPDQYTSFQFSRNFLQEVTRLRLSVDWLFGASSGGLLAEYPFAPATKDIRALAKKQGNNSIRALLPWEIYSGILPKFETIHEVNYVAGRGEKRRGIKGNLQGAVKNYAQRTANFNYMKYRFAARMAEVSSKFNPFIVCGFPMAIIERPFLPDLAKIDGVRKSIIAEKPGLLNDDMSEFVKSAAKELGAPLQYLGMVASLSHSVSQEGGTTSVTLTHARTHRITNDDFLNVFSKELTRQVDTEIVSTVLDAETLLKTGNWKLLKFLKDATPQNLNEQEQLAQETDTEEIDLGDEFPPLEDRPDGLPNSKFGSLLAPEEDPKATKVALPPASPIGTGGRVPIRGRVKKDRLKNGRQTILVPDPGGKLHPGARGPKGGKIVQIQCFTDAAIGVIGKDINKRVGAKEPVIIMPGIIDEFVRDEKTGKLKLRDANVVRSDQVYYLWKSIAIYEEVKKPKVISKLLPVEEALRPPWFSPLYSNWFIGSEIYEPFFGTGSVVDQALFVSPTGEATFGTGRDEQREILDKLYAAGNDRQKVLGILEDAEARSISEVPDVESSLDVLAYIYGEVVRQGLDVHRFVNDYTKRPIASMEDMLGSADLRYEEDGDKLKLVGGSPGFHSTAIAPFKNLKGLIDNPDLLLSRLKNASGKKSPVNRALDPRPGRREKVEAYLREIGASAGSLGVGVAG